MDRIQPMEPILVNKIIEDPDFIHQIKWDGIRILSSIQDGELNLYTKRGNIRNIQYPELKQLIHSQQIKNAIFDGEVIAMEGGKPSFYKILVRDRNIKNKKIKILMKTIPVYYVIFDILSYQGKDFRRETFMNRFELLNDIITQRDGILLSENYNDSEGLYRLIKENNYEGIVSKKINSIYVPGKVHNSWFKYKLNRKMLCILCGVRLNDDGRVKSLHLGINSDNNLIYVGSVSSGLTQKEINLLGEYKNKIQAEQHYFQNIFPGKENIWFKSLITCWISFMEWTNEGVVRHGKILGFSEKRWQEADGTEYVE